MAKVHRKIRNIRKDAQHKMTCEICKSHADIIAIEDLNTRGMLKNHKLASLAGMTISQIQRLEYGVSFCGKHVEVVVSDLQ